MQKMEETPEETGHYKCSKDEMAVLCDATGKHTFTQTCTRTQGHIHHVFANRTSTHARIHNCVQRYTQTYVQTYVQTHKFSNIRTNLHINTCIKQITGRQSYRMDDDNLDKFHVPLYFTHTDKNLTPSSFPFATGLGKRAASSAASSKGTKEYIDFDDVLGAYRAILPLSFACLHTHTYTHLRTHIHTCTHTMCILPPHPSSLSPYPSTLLCLFPSRHFLCSFHPHLSSSPKISNVFDSLDVDLCLYTSRELAFFYSVVGMTVEMLKLKSAESAKEEELAQVLPLAVQWILPEKNSHCRSKCDLICGRRENCDQLPILIKIINKIDEKNEQNRRGATRVS